MSLDFRKTTYRPNRPQTRLGTSYGRMSQWMAVLTNGQNVIKRPDYPSYVYIQAHEQREPPYVFPKLRESELAIPDRRRAENSVTLPPIDPVHLQYCNETGYDDFHKAYRHKEKQLPTLSYPVFGPPRLRQGRAGGCWRHVKEVMQARGRRTLFVDGQIRLEDNDRLNEVPGGNMLQPHVNSQHIQPDDTSHVTQTDLLLPQCSSSNRVNGYAPESTVPMGYSEQYNQGRMTHQMRYHYL